MAFLYSHNKEIYMEAVINCSKCTTVLGENDKFCNSCGFPERGTEEDQKKYNYRIKIKKDVIEDAQKKLKNVRGVLYFIIGINVLVGIYYLTNDLTFYDGLGSLIAAVIFTGCLIWVNKQALTGILAAFVFWIVLQLLAIIVDPSTIIQGLLLKIIIVGVFIKGIISARDLKKYTIQLEEMKAV